MANLNVTTEVQEPPLLGIELAIPDNKIHEISIILRVIMALDTHRDVPGLRCQNDVDTLIDEGEPYEIMKKYLIWYQKELDWYQNNISDIANRIYEVLIDEHD